MLILWLALASFCAGGQMGEWESLARRTARQERLPKGAAEQVSVMVEAAIDDAVSATAPFGGGASAEVACAVAAHDVLSKLFPTRRAQFDAALGEIRTDLEDGVLKEAMDAGHRAARAVLSSEWSFKSRARRPRAQRLPAVLPMTLPLHQTDAEPMPAARRASAL